MADRRERRGRGFGMGLLAGIVGTLVLLAAIALIVIYGGRYDVAATDRHADIVRWAFDTTMRNSVQRHADGLAPPAFTPADLRNGAEEFREYCVHCHGAPGAEPHEWASGMLPDPPPLSQAARHWETAEIFWIVKHGIKMSGMPPFGEGHQDRTLWNIAAFVKQLPQLSPEQYRALTASSEGGEGGEGGGSGGHSHDHSGHTH